MRFADEGTTWCDFDPESGDPVTTDRTLLDAAGRQFVVRTDRRCLYARKPLPAGEGDALRYHRRSTAAIRCASPTTESSSNP